MSQTRPLGKRIHCLLHCFHEVLVAEPHSPQDTHTAPTDPVTEPTLNLVQSSNVFDEEVADIAQLHCNSELFEFELSTSPPCVNVKGNLLERSSQVPQ